MTETVEIKRGFVDLAHGQIHYRHAGSGEPILTLHASPGSSRQLLSVIGGLAAGGKVYAPDTPGNGDSVPLFDREPILPELAEAALRFMDAMGLETVKLYGSHTGAAIAAELAILAPERISHIVLDGVSWLTPEELEDILANYAFPFVPDQDGAHLTRLFQFCRDQYMFFPWYKRTREGRRDNGLGSAADLHAWALEVMKASETYHLNYRAAFKWNARDRLPLVTVPALFMAGENDPLFDITSELSSTIAGGRFVALPRFDAPNFVDQRHAAITTFFAERSSTPTEA
ncbi:alpha/beta fold hydrolase [Sphingobium boeckii]|uniref:Pimeloyl-ACP methyl ester carboxylesterase n=1 Tax=Sphingobium boeckii TaxID=1082345 RepID=A0A7W9ALH5_9SPHN|nr:alpha/beta hydrolase [Sphingobium boeckii]MBB5687691.1 pimeloyl-ACP methyl ester carboxylesterase [Sphingobium boeckii]